MNVVVVGWLIVCFYDDCCWWINKTRGTTSKDQQASPIRLLMARKRWLLLGRRSPEKLPSLVRRRCHQNRTVNLPLSLITGLHPINDSLSSTNFPSNKPLQQTLFFNSPLITHTYIKRGSSNTLHSPTNLTRQLTLQRLRQRGPPLTIPRSAVVIYSGMQLV